MIVKFIVSIAFVVALNFSGLAQQSTNSAGGDINSSTGSVNYSLGQVFYDTQNSATGSSSQGVQQAYTISTLFVKKKSIDLTIKIYPNPTTDLLQLTVTGLKDDKLSYKMTDLNGKQIVSGRIQEGNTPLDLHALPSATYFIEVLHDADQLQLFKVVKTN